ncbi:MAG: hypothetical protein EOO28_27955 [Comamonadaceae bacterium]|nr:MAG: hypothetical protein EOO28_27955 [Comamonadaceae bacterium]
MAAAKERDALYVKLKTNSLFTVNREIVDFMAQHFDQDTTFVTHFALARLRDDILSGRLENAADIPVLARDWIDAGATDAIRKQVESRMGAVGVNWKSDNPALSAALDEM